jgi:hypothetical protein
MEIFVSTSDGKFSCLRHKGILYYCGPDELAKQLGIEEYQIELDPGQRERDKKDAARRRVREVNAQRQSIERWGI